MGVRGRIIRMSETALYNLSGRAIPPDAKLVINGEPKPGDVLVIESFDGVTGAANWRSEAHAKARLAGHVQTKGAKDSATPPASTTKPRAPYS